MWIQSGLPIQERQTTEGEFSAVEGIESRVVGSKK